MGKEQITVLHIDTEKKWRGGQQQAAYLLEAMHKNKYQTALVCQPHSKMEAFCLQHALPYFSIKMRGEIDFIAAFRIAKLCRKYNFKILHLHSAHALSIGLWTNFFYRKLKLIAVRRVDFFIKKNWFSQFKYKTRLIDKIVCVSNAITNVLIEGGIPREKLITIHSGIDTHKFDNIKADKNFKTEIGIPNNHIVVGTVAALAGHKDYPNLLRAAEIVLQKHSNVIFYAIGDGPEKEKIHRMAREFNLNNKFIFQGFQKNIGQYLKIFDIFVLASKKEGLGTSILDAQSVGLPVVACKTGGIPEAVFNKKNGLLVPPRNEQTLADAISLLVSDVQLRKELGKNSLQTVIAFDIKNTIQKNIELYKNLLKEEYSGI